MSVVRYVLRCGIYVLCCMFSMNTALAVVHDPSLIDTDLDGIPDAWETNVYHSDPLKKDSDGDGHDDLVEIRNGFDPNGRGPLLVDDADHDGLNDRLELLFGSDPTVADTDGDGFTDGVEIDAGFSPTDGSRVSLEKRIVITLSKQLLEQRLGDVTIASFPVSSGKPSTFTPTGDFRILEKLPRRWSFHAKLWMPWWMMIEGKKVIGIHELPEYPNGRKEGADHLGKAVSGGCVRLGIGSAKTLYDWSTTGTKVLVLH